MDGSNHSQTTGDQDWLVARSVKLRHRVQRVQRNRRPPDQPAARDLTDAAILRENDRILWAIEDSARRELAQIEQALARYASEPGVS